MPALRTMWMIIGVLCLLPATASAQSGIRSSDPDEQDFLQARAEKLLLNPKDDAAKQKILLQAMGNLNEIPKGYTSLLKAIELYKSRAQKTPNEKFAGSTWKSWYARCMHQLSLHPAVVKNPELFPTECIEDYCNHFFAKLEGAVPAYRATNIAFVGRLGPRAKVALPRLRELVDHEDDAVALAAFRAIKKIAPAP
jgi:hypothetical protein